jgi:hypothetical protein
VKEEAPTAEDTEMTKPEDSDDDDEEDQPKMSKRKLKKMNQLTVAGVLSWLDILVIHSWPTPGLDTLLFHVRQS